MKTELIDTMQNKELRSELMLLLAAVIWGGGFVAGKLALTSLKPFAVLAWRFGCASLLVFLIFHKRILHTPRATIRSGIILGAVQMTALGMQLSGLQYTTSAKQSFL